jgi:hypothetical protein
MNSRMIATPFTATRLAALLIASAIASTDAVAALGTHAAAMQTEQLRMKATLVERQTAKFSVHELHTATGITIREYAAADGIIFAVSWQGPTKPDLLQLLGNYFAQYRAALRTADATHRHAHIELPTLVVTESARQRLFAGTAYDPSLLPSGVTAAEIQ